jgi:hypothetical protein
LFLWVSRYPTPSGEVSWAARGEWSLVEGRFNGEIGTSSISMFPVGYRWSDEVLSADEELIVLRNQSGKTETCRRR